MSILIINSDAEHYRDSLKAACPDAEIHAVRKRDAAEEYIEDARAIFAFASSVSPALLAKAKKLEWIQALSSGTDKFVELCADRPEVSITSTRGVQGPAVAEMAFTHMLALSRDLPGIIANQKQSRWAWSAQPLLHGKTIVIVGTGLIATELARRCRVFGMTVIGVSSTPRPLPEFDRVHDRADLQETAALADFMVLLVPLTAETHHLIDKPVLNAMKPSAVLINLARGSVCNEQAVLEAVQQNQIKAVGLDVFETEPLPADSPLWQTENILITPHLGGESDRYADQVLPILTSNLKLFLLGQPEQMQNVIER